MLSVPRFSLLLWLLVLTGTLSAQQDSPAADKKPEQQTGATSVAVPPPQAENWTVLNDIKTGLAAHAPLVGGLDEQPDFVRELVSLQWRVGDPIDVWIMRPKTSGKVPVVFYLYSYPDDPGQFRDNGWCHRTTAGGFAAVGFVSALTGQRYHLRPMKQWFVSELPEALGSTVHDVQLILNYLATRPEFDVDHVGMVGMGSGAAIAILAAQADPRIKTLDLLDPWGDWPDWLRESPVIPAEERPKYLTEEFLKSVAPVDPVLYLPHLKTLSVRLQQTASDPITPKAVQERIASASHDPKQVVKYANPQEHLKAWQTDGLSGWIKQQLRAQAENKNRDNHRAALNSNSR
jgi:cephalosporin-C deacetylase-like acetyl esterase